ncbi:hypothetical protein DICPUDRAFT_49138 [Dictyostelium purpureum]|uniref:Uncharacterized protein n=1 Tax=Dictyostelium purpureum TaxID=5786 RepID=F0ZSE3_DICPU|nr:uncharacterized protein DICPUDRAFT_49138 [Dictyostelium purpureum]EGC33136.1 hypothetical protein DICPUDRAFT_49138 [Dictyostelium purpureum]|eukprot:XP_003290331.1 hypothetical protein DICPUDRAFT_49138 [Dictyostelium purpureum]
MDDDQYFINQRLVNAAKRGEDESVEEFILDAENKVDINCVDSIGETSAHWAAKNNHADVLKVLIKYKANVNAVTASSNETPLHKAAYKNNLDAIRVLVIDGKADVSIKDKDGNTPLQIAKDVECRKLLVPRVDTSVDDPVDADDSDNE